MSGANTLARRKKGKETSRGPDERVVIAHLKGTQAYADWLDEVHRKTLVPKTAIIRRAVAEWAQRNGHPEPPEF